MFFLFFHPPPAVPPHAHDHHHWTQASPCPTRPAPPHRGDAAVPRARWHPPPGQTLISSKVGISWFTMSTKINTTTLCTTLNERLPRALRAFFAPLAGLRPARYARQVDAAGLGEVRLHIAQGLGLPRRAPPSGTASPGVVWRGLAVPAWRRSGARNFILASVQMYLFPSFE